MESNHTCYRGDALDVLPGLPKETVQLVVTSPPYWSIKDYGCNGQIGIENSYEEYIARLEKVWKECWRVLSPGCRLAVNIGEQYLRARDHGEYGIKPIPSDLIRGCTKIGLKYLGGVIWRKISTTNTTGGCSWMGSIYYPRDGYVTYEHEFILLFKKRGKTPPPTREAKAKSKLTKAQRSKWFRGIWDDVHPARQNGHVAQFPIEIPERLVRMFTYWGETVLDPFVGSGTTGVAASRAGRNSIGIEINPDFVSGYSDRAKEEGFALDVQNRMEVTNGQRRRGRKKKVCMVQ